jgi:dihydroorotase
VRETTTGGTSAPLLIRGGRVIDPSQGIDRHMDVWIVDGHIVSLGASLGDETERAQPLQPGPPPRILDVPGCVVAPGFLDVHTHLREPGFEYKETIASGLAAAAAGGFTGVAAMANTQPVNDHPAVTELMRRRAAAVGGTRLYPIGAVSAGLAGKELSEIGGMHEAGIVALSDDGMPVMNARLMRRAMEYGRMLNLPVLSHCEDRGLAAGGVMHEGVVSTALGLPGVPGAAENVMVYRDQGIRVTAEACPHHFTLTHEAIRQYDTNTKVNPPLRTAADVEAIKAGLQDGTIDIIASDHAPHHVAEKEQDYESAPAGMIGLETSVGLSLALYHQGVLSLAQLIAKFTMHPARLLGTALGTLEVGSPADITIVAPEQTFVVDASSLRSQSRNTPFLGWQLRGVAVATIVGGNIIFERL